MFKKLMMAICVVSICAGGGVESFAQRRNKKEKDAVKKEAPAKDTTAAPKKPAKKGPVAIDKFIKADAKVMKGLTTVYKQEGKFYINIPDSLLGRDIRVVSRVSKSAEGIRGSFSGYAGDIINSAMLHFEKGENNKIYLKSRMYRERSNEVMPENVANSNYPAIVAAFDIKAFSADKKDNIIDVTDFLMSDSEYLFFSKRDKKGFKLANLQKDKSYVHDVTTYPINTEFKVVYTYGRTEGTPTATYMLNSSFVLLPEKPMVARYEDPRVGYFTVRYVDFDKNPQRVENTKLITRWRLEPKPEDLEKYKRGELVEPAKPIVYYIDPATPKEWVPYLIAGVNDWQPAFEKAGFKNAIMAKVAPTPEEDPTWSLEDARYSAIVYKPSDIPNASGPHVNDPRSGEIIESHINWYHNVMLLLRNWYFIQCSPVDPAARKMTFDTELMGQLVRFVSSHEVGHTLGLRHNFAGTAFFTADQLRDTTFLRKHGHTTSIMDYSRFNYVAQPGDNIPQELLFPRINTYDEWAIEWGYRRFPEIDDPKAELPKINEWIIEKTKDPLYRFGTESNPSDPRLQSEDLGENQMETNELGVKNLKYIMEHLVEWTTEPNKGYDNLRTLYGEVLTQYKRYMNHVAKYVGGVYGETKVVEQPGANYTHVSKEKQKEAISFLKKHLFEPQLWLVPNDVLDKITTRPDDSIEGTYTAVLKNLVSRRVMLNLVKDEVMNGANAYTMADFYKDMDGIVFTNISSDVKKAAYQRMLQKAYVDAIISLYKREAPAGRPGAPVQTQKSDNSDVTAMAYYQLKAIKAKCTTRAASGTTATKAHYTYLVEHIENILEQLHEKK